MADLNSTPSTIGLSTSIIAGIVIVAVAALVLAGFLTYVFLRRRRNGNTNDEEKAPRMLQVQESISRTDLQQTTSPNPRLGRSVSRRNLTPSIILPLPAPPIPTARPRPSMGLPSPAMHTSGRPMSSVEIVTHHQASGTMPRPFSPRSIAEPPPVYDATGVRTSTDSSFSFSRASILPTSLRNSFGSSSLRSSMGSSSARLGSEMLIVRHIFTPLLPDELVLRPNEKVTLIQTFEDGWYIVGRKSPFYAPGPAKPSGYAFGKGVTADEVEIGAVPSWVFERRAIGTKLERPMRTVSLGVTLVDEGMEGSAEVRDGVMSWSNF